MENNDKIIEEQVKRYIEFNKFYSKLANDWYDMRLELCDSLEEIMELNDFMNELQQRISTDSLMCLK